MTYFIQSGDYLIEVKNEKIVKSHLIPYGIEELKTILRDVVKIKTEKNVLSK